MRPKPYINFYVLIPLCYFTLSFNLSSQNQSSKWIFGNQTGIDFTSLPPTTLSNNAINASNGSACISDPGGNLLFYTDGVTVWNKQHAVMANGNGLMGNSAGQRALIAKQPGNANLYYIFTAASVNTLNIGTRYSVVDMNLASGQGSVTIKNNLLSSGTVPKLTGVLHCNGVDFWIVIHKDSSNTFLSYQLTASGLNPLPVVSQIGSLHNTLNSIGSMKVSPNGKKLAVALYGSGGSIELFDFDKSNGQVSNPVSLGNIPFSRFCEFSPDGTKLYGSKYNSNLLLQWDLCAGTSADIINSLYTYTTNTYNLNDLQLAINGKIYAVRNPSIAVMSPTLGVIQTPNQAGLSMNYNETGQVLSGNSGFFCLPNFIGSYHKELPQNFSVTYNQVVSCLTASFSIPQLPAANSCAAASSSYSSFYWIFGDPASGVNNISGLGNPNHTFSSPGTYTIKLVLQGNCTSDTLIQNLYLPPAPTLSINGNSSICNGQSGTLTVSGANTYTWSNLSTNSILVVSPSVTTVYTVSGSHTNTACKSSGTFTLNVDPCTGLSEQEAYIQQIRTVPNPNQGLFYVELTGDCLISLFNNLGEKVFGGIYHAGRQEINICHLGTGVYLLELEYLSENDTVYGVQKMKLIKN